MRLLRPLAIVSTAIAFANLWLVVSAMTLVTALIGIAALAAYLRERLADPTYQTVTYAAAAAAVLVLHFGGPPQDPITPGTRTEASISTEFDRMTDEMTVTYNGDIVRQEMENSESLRQKDPEAWRQQMRERLDRLREKNKKPE